MTTMLTSLSGPELLAAASGGGIPTPLVIIAILVLAGIGWYGITRRGRK